MLTDQQLKNRLSGIGGSDAGAICGFSPYMTALDVYLYKKGLKESKSDSRQMKWGSLLEPVIRANYVKEFGKDVIETEETFYHKDYPFMLAHVDGLIGDDGILEVKTTQFLSKDWGAQFTDHVPKSYLLQCVHYMAVLDRDYVDLALLIGGSDERFFHIKRNLNLEKKLIETESWFWNECVLKDMPPEYMQSKEITSQLKSDIELQDAIGFVVDETIQPCIDDYVYHKTRRDFHDSEMESYKNVICDFLDRNNLEEMLNADRKPILTYKTENRTTIDRKTLEKDHPSIYEKYSKTTSFKTFRIMK